MKILVISSYFGPETSVGVLRINAFVKYWLGMGHEVVVLTMPFSGALPEGLAGNASLSVCQVAPWLLGTRQSGGAQGYSKGSRGWKRSLLRFQYWLKRRYLCNYLDPRILWWPRVVLQVRKMLRQGASFDTVFSTVPSYTAHSAASVIKRLDSRMKWVADYRDLWFGNPIFPGCGLVRLMERVHERLILANADMIVSINEELIAELRANHGGGRKYLVVPNGFEDAELDRCVHAQLPARAHPGINIVYAGSILPGLQDPSPLFAAVRDMAVAGELRPEDLSICFYGDYAVLDDFPLARDPHVARHLKLCGKVSRSDILAIQRSTDFLLFLGSRPVSSRFGSTRGVVSGKVFEYLISGAEIMAVGVTDDMLVAEMIEHARAGSSYGQDAERIKERLRRALHGEIARMEPDMSYLDQFRRSVQAKVLINAIERL